MEKQIHLSGVQPRRNLYILWIAVKLGVELAVDSLGAGYILKKWRGFGQKL